MNIYLFDKISELKDKFTNFLQQRKKLKALENYSSAVPFKHKEYLKLIKKCMNDGFLADEEAKFLSHMIEKYFKEQNFLDWSHKTRWLKREMGRLSSNYEKEKESQLPLFDWEKKNPQSTIPISPHILSNRRAGFAIGRF